MAPASALEEITEEYHHLQSEHRKAGSESSVRRHLRARLNELERRFERLLVEEVAGEPEREAWRQRLHHGGAAPATAALARPLLFRGCSEAGSIVEIRERLDGDADVEIDGSPVAVRHAELAFDVYRDGDREFEEVFGAPADALEALRVWVESGSGDPPWDHAHALIEDGLVARHFELTARGRRSLRARAPGT
jgi:hypothetical protein